MIKIQYLTVTPESTGEPIVGPSVYAQAPDTIEVVGVEHMIRREYDEAHGTPSGDRKHTPLKIIKSVDCTTPTLFVMCANAEMCTEVKLESFIQIGNQPDPVNFFTITLINAYISEVRRIPAMEMTLEYAEQYDELEEIAFTYQQITMEHHSHRAPIGLKDLPGVIQSDAWSSTA